MSGAHDVTEGPIVASILTLRWVLKRTALGLGILFCSVAVAAWLMHAGIQPEPANASAPSPTLAKNQAAVPTGSLPGVRH